MFNTLIDLEDSTRRSLTALLNQRLADMVDLFNQTKYAHWNVKGPDFIQLHELFDDVAERLEGGCDLLAERVVTLGGTAVGTTRQSANNSSISEYDLRAVDGHEHLISLAGQIVNLAASVRNAIKESDRLGDPTTADLFTEISRTLDKDLWLFLEAHLQAR